MNMRQDVFLLVILLLSLQSCYSSTEAHRHAHETINVCSEHPVYDEDGRRLP